jgi:ribosome-associated protein
MADTPEETENQEYDRPSKSERKRAAHAAQELGEVLIRLRDQDLEALRLPESLNDAIREARHITSRAAGARQRQYIGKLMRDVDLEPIRAALAAHSGQAALEAERFKRIETWRERLIVEGAAGLEELNRWRPGLSIERNRPEWTRLISAAQAERARSGAVGAASRELFRALRGLFDTMSE